MSSGTLDAADTSNTGVATLPPNTPLDWDENEDLLWIRAEIEKSTKIEKQSVPVDWPGIVVRAKGFLTLTTDWVLVAAAARAAVHVDGLGALPRALEMLTTTANASWKTMQPALPRGLSRRASYLSWFAEGLAEAVQMG